MSNIDDAANEIMAILRKLPTPRYAAAALAIVRANLHSQAGGNTEAKIRKMIVEDDMATLEIWMTINAANLVN